MNVYVVMAWLDPESWEPCAVFDHEPSTLEAARPAIRAIRNVAGDSETVRSAYGYRNTTSDWGDVFSVRPVPMPDAAAAARAGEGAS